MRLSRWEMFMAILAFLGGLSLLLVCTASVSPVHAAECVKLTPYEARLGVSAHSGILVLDVTPDSIADRAGLQAGDVIVRVNNKTMRNAGHFQFYLGQLRELALWDTADVEVMREGQIRHAILRLATPEERFGFASGLAFLVAGVRSGGPAAKAGIQPGEFLLEVAGQKLSEIKGPTDVDALVAGEKVSLRLGRILSVGNGAVSWTTRTIEVEPDGQGPLDGPSPPPTGVVHVPEIKKK